MFAHPSQRRVGAAVALLVAGAFALTGCSGTPATDAPDAAANTADINRHVATGTPNETLRELLPQSVLDAGVLSIATDATIGEPFGTYDTDGATMVGIAPDLAYAIGDALGVDVELNQVVFANLIPGLKADRYAFSLAPMLHTEERQKEVDFVDYLKGGSTFIIAKGSATSDSLTPADVCGLTVGYQAGSVEEIAMQEQNAKCTEAGKPEVTGLAYKTNNEGVLALTSDRIETYATSAAQGGFITLQDNEQLQVSGDPFSGGLSGMAFPKDSEVLPAIVATLQELIDNGTYMEILSSYGIEYLAVDSAESNVN